jgi:hypothetical protein
MTVTKQAALLGRSYNTDESVAGDNVQGFDPGAGGGLARAKTGSLTTRTDNTTGSLTLEASHGVNTGDKFDLYWGGTSPGKRVGVVAGAVAGNVVPISGGAGDNLPLAATAVTVMEPDREPLELTGDDLVGIVLYGQGRTTVSIFSAADALLHQFDLEAGESYVWSSASGLTNPLAGVTPSYVLLSHDDGTQARTVRGAFVYN